MHLTKYATLALVLFLLAACNTSKPVVTPLEEIPEVIVEEEFMDTLTVSAAMPEKLKKPEDYKLPKYNPSATQKADLLHTQLEVSFDWAKQRLMGKATLKLKPYFYPIEELVLDAKNFDIHNVSYTTSKEKPLKYDYNGEKLTIDLGRSFRSNERIELFIDYTAKPTEAPTGGSAAITSDQGLYFINHDNSIAGKPQQIWTQGETEANSRWFPTIDKPNERCTQEMYITVEERFKTLSNGLLISSKKNSDGTRTDYWKMDLPHAPYLFMMAIGEFAVVKDDWKGMLVDYYVEPDYKKDAREIFRHTVEMLEFFSNKIGVKYPWPKYSQVVVRDYVSGAMENTTGVIFGEFIQGHERELIDVVTFEYIVAHELFHHWFGDLVTCESWANLTLQEGFANYGEYLWAEHKYGVEEADLHRVNEMNGYIGSTRQGGIHPLIYFGYDDKEDMFDAHSYNKGGLVLHMLRDYVGDEAFWASLKLYLEKHQYTQVEADELRMAFEDVTGEDLNWFWDQWYFSAGHPQIEINYDYNAENKIASVTIEQTQDTEKNPAIFILPMSIDVYTGPGQFTRHKVKMDKRLQTFTFESATKPMLINVDANRTLLYEKKDNKTEEEYVFQYNNAPKYLDRREALRNLKGSSTPEAIAVFEKALNDNFWNIRSMAIDGLQGPTPAQLEKVAVLAQNDKHSKVRAKAISKLGQTNEAKYAAIAKKAIENERPYSVISSALSTLVSLDKNAAMSYAHKLEDEKNANILAAVGDVYAMEPNAKNLSFFEKSFSKVDGFDAISFFENYAKVLAVADEIAINKAMGNLKGIALNQSVSPWKRFASTKTMHETRQNYQDKLASVEEGDKAGITAKIEEITGMINEIKSKEENGQLKMIYNNF